MNKRSPSYNFLRDNAQLRAAVKFRLDVLNPNHKFAIFERALDFPYQKIGKFYRGDKNALTNFQIMRLCEFLGIEVSLKLEIKEFPSDQALELLQTRKKTKNESYFT